MSGKSVLRLSRDGALSNMIDQDEAIWRWTLDLERTWCARVLELGGVW